MKAETLLCVHDSTELNIKTLKKAKPVRSLFTRLAPPHRTRGNAVAVAEASVSCRNTRHRAAA